jgi:hypothetical protein
LTERRKKGDEIPRWLPVAPMHHPEYLTKGRQRELASQLTDPTHPGNYPTVWGEEETLQDRKMMLEVISERFAKKADLCKRWDKSLRQKWIVVAWDFPHFSEWPLEILLRELGANQDLSIHLDESSSTAWLEAALESPKEEASIQHKWLHRPPGGIWRLRP